MRNAITVKDLLTEVGTLVGMYDSEYRIDNTAPAAEQVYCRELADNGHTQDSLLDRWVVLEDSAGVWRQRKIREYAPSSNILSFYHSTGDNRIFAHTNSTLYLFDITPPQLLLRTVIPELATQTHLATLQGVLTLNMTTLNAEFTANKTADPKTYASTRYRIWDTQGYHVFVGIGGISQVLRIRVDGDIVPVDYWRWDYYGNGDYEDNGVLTLENTYSRSKVEVTYSDNPSPSDFDITDWEAEVATLEPRAGESLKYSCAARWMSATLPSMDEEGWNYAKRTETHFRNRAQALDIVLPATLR